MTAYYTNSKREIPTYDAGFGPLWISRNSIGTNGIIRAKSFEEAYNTCEDEFFPEADETIEEIVKDYGFKREYRKVVNDGTGERFEVYPDDYPDGRLKPEFVRWETIETPDPDAWADNELFQEAFGFRPNGPNARDKHNHGIYQKDLNGDSLDKLTPELIADLGITIELEDEDEDQ